MWLNIDNPTKKVTLHEDDCPFIPKSDSKYKKINDLGPDGGWLPCNNREEALQIYENDYKDEDYKLGYCYTCDPKKAPTEKKEEPLPILSEKELFELREESGNASWEYTATRFGFEDDDED